MKESVKQFAKSVYDATFAEKERAALEGRPRKKPKAAERLAQKEAIRESILKTMEKYPREDASDIWRAIYEIHIHRKSGIDNAETIEKVVGADQSWKKSSGHAFEEMVKILANAALDGTDIEVVLQRDLNLLIKAEDAEKYTKPEDFDGVVVGAQNASLQMDLVTSQLPNAKAYTIGEIVEGESKIEII